MNIVDSVPNTVIIRNIIISVSDKTGLDTFVPDLVRINPGIRIYSTGGSYEKLRKILKEGNEKNLIPVSEYTGQPEMQGGLVKTLDYRIYLGLLGEPYNPVHSEDLKRTGAVEIDMAAVNLYPFEETVASPDCTLETARGNIDIGGPCMLRASAKNFLRAASVCDPADYPSIIEEMERTGGGLTLETRFSLAKKSFAHTAAYDSSITAYLSGYTGTPADPYTVLGDEYGSTE